MDHVPMSMNCGMVLLLSTNLNTSYCCRNSMRTWLRVKANAIIDRVMEELLD